MRLSDDDSTGAALGYSGLVALAVARTQIRKMLSVRDTPTLPAPRDDAVARAAESAIIPGLGQLRQGRYAAAIAQFGTVVAYLFAAGSIGGRAMLFALLWNVWSIIDAARHGKE